MPRSRSARVVLALLPFLLVSSCVATTLPGRNYPPMRNPLQCSWPAGQAPDQGTATIGPDGGVLNLSHSRLKVPKGALSEPVTFTMRELSDTVGVQITPSRTFARPASVRIDVGGSRCTTKVDRDDYWAWRIPDGGGAAEKLPTRRPFFSRQMIGEITSNSWVIIAN